MSAPLASVDATTKRWLGVLALAALASVVILTRSFLNVFSPPQAKDGTEAVREVRTSEQGAMSRSGQFQTVQESGTGASPFEFSNSDMATPRQKEAVAKEMVRNQAEQLRAMIKKDKLPEAYGHLTLEQVDEMEKQGVLIE